MRWALVLLALACCVGLLVLPAGAAPSASPSTVDIVVDESVAPGDGSTATGPAPVGSDEPVGTIDAVTVSPPASVPGAEGVTVTDDVSVVPPVTIVVDESVSPSDAPAVVPPASVPAAEQALVTDEVAVVARTLPPGPPTTVVAAAGDGSAAVSWLPPARDGGGSISGYTVTPHDVTTNADGAAVATADTSASVSGLTNGDAYTFVVTASNEAGPGAASEPSRPVTPQAGAAPPAAAAGSVDSGGTVSAGSGNSSDSPLGASVTTPTGGTITIAAGPVGGSPPAGYQLVGQEVVIAAPQASAADPLSLSFTIDSSLLGVPSASQVQVFRDGALVADCADSSGSANPDPCLASRVFTKRGSVTITVLTSHASTWTFGTAAAPVVVAGGPYFGDEGAPVALHGTATNGAGLPMTFSWDLGGGVTATGPNPVVVVGDGPATAMVTLTVCVDGGSCASDTTTLTIANVPPTATLTAPATAPEGTSPTVSVTGATDASAADVAAGLHYAIVCDGSSLAAVTYASVSTTASTTCPAVDGPGDIAVRARVIDKDGGYVELTKTIHVTNVAPAPKILAPDDGSVFRAGMHVALSGSFTDPGVLDTHTAVWTVGGTTIPATVAEHGGSGTVAATWTPSTAGFYPFSLTVADKDGGTATVAGGTLVVVDPDAGFVTGAGALLDPSRGLVFFEFDARYHDHTAAPRGEVALRVPHLGLVATQLDWLVVTSPSFALQGTGRVGRTSGYRFRLDGTNGRPDELRIRIWTPDGSLVYDSTQRPLRFGSINLHRS